MIICLNKGKASLPTGDLTPKSRRFRNQHSVAFEASNASTDIYKGSVFPKNSMEGMNYGLECPPRLSDFI